MALSLRQVATAVAVAVAGLLVAMLVLGEWAIGDGGRRQRELADSTMFPLARIGDLYHVLTRTRLHEGELLRTDRESPVLEIVERITEDVGEVTQLLDGIEQGLPTAGRDELFGIVEQWRRYRVDLDRVTEAARQGDFDQAARYVHFLTGPRFTAIVAQLERLHEDVAGRMGSSLQVAAEARSRFRWILAVAALAGIVIVATVAGVFVAVARGRIARLQRALASLGTAEEDVAAGIAGRDEIAELAALVDAARLRLDQQQRQAAELLQLAEGREVERVRDLRRTRADLRRERRACKDLDARHRLLSDALEQCPVDLVLLDLRGNVVHASRRYLQRESKRLGEVVGKRPALIAEREDRDSLFEKMWTMVLSGTPWQSTIENAADDGRPHRESLRAIPVRGADGIVSHALLIREASDPAP
ncbi:MAG: PAS domain-containing protein [Rhodocyclaceae bacterium]|nr:PAS domain-containing protein [Rhodocyclaceae bacterium]